MSTDQTKRLSYLNIEISEKGLSEFSGNKRTVFIPKAEIQTVKLKFGSSAEQPLLQLVIGTLLSVLGIIGIVMIADSGMRGLRWGYGFVFFGALGIWLLHETLTKRHYLEVICSKGKRKLVFRGRFEILGFSKLAKDMNALGYDFIFSTAAA